MAVTIQVKLDTSDLSKAPAAIAPVSAALKTVEDKMKAVEAASGQATSKMVTGLHGLAQQVTRTTVEQGNLSKAFLQTGAAAQTQLTQFQKLQQEYIKTANASKSAQTGLSGLLTTFKGLAAAAGIGLSVQGLIAFTKSVMEAGIAHDRLMLSLKGALGSAQAAGDAYQFVSGVANRLGIGLFTAVEGFAKLAAATQGTVVQGAQTRELFVALSEASRVMGLTTAETGGVMTALTQIIGKNTVSMEELRQQLGERLPSALRLTAKEMGVTTSRFIEMVSKGEVLATDFIPAVTRAFQQMGREAPAAAQSAQAALERLGNAWLNLKITIANSGLIGLVASIGEEMTRIVNQTTNWINRTKRMAGELGLAPMVEEMQRLTQQIQRNKEVTEGADLAGPFSEQAQQVRNTTIALEAQRDALATQIQAKQQVVEQNEKAQKSESELEIQTMKNVSAKEAEIAVLKKSSSAWINVNDDIKEVETSLKALRSFDVDSLKALQIDPDAADFEQKWNQAEAFLLKRQKELLDKRAGINKGDADRAVKEAGESAVEIAKAREDALATSLKREEALIQQSADERRHIVDEEARAALQTQGPGAVEAIDAKRSQARRQIAVDEAKFLETLRLKAIDDQAKAQEIRLNAEIAGAGKNLSAATKAQEELKNLSADTEQERVKIRQKTEESLLNVSKKGVDDQIALARTLNKIIKETEEDRLKARIGLVDEQIALVKAQMDGEVLTTKKGIDQIQALETQRFDDIRLQYEQQAQAAIDVVNAIVKKTVEGTDERVEAERIAAEQIKGINEGLGHQLEAVNLQQQTQQQEHLNTLTQGWRDWVKDVRSALSDFLVDLFEGQIKSIKDIFNSLKSYFFKIIADMIAYAATQQIIIPIVSAVLGGVGGAAGGGMGGGGAGGLLQTGLGVLGLGQQVNSLFGGASPLAGAIGGLTKTVWGVINGFDSILMGQDALAAAMESAAYSDLSFVTGGALEGAPAAAGLSPTLGAIGGLAAIGTGIYGALNATNNASKAAFAASAAAGTAALASTALVAAGVIAASSGWTGIGLIAAAVTAIIGTVTQMLIKPAGPALAVGKPSGLGITTEGGQLAVEGDLGSKVIRREGVDPGMAKGVQAQLEAGITSAVMSIVQTINSVALDPTALLAPTQQALQDVLRAVQPLNSANAKKMEKDIEEQLKFISVSIVTGMLEPVNKAFDQLRDMGTVEEQIGRLPGTTEGLVAIFKTMNEQLDEIGASQNTDVLRQLSRVRNQVENFGNRIAGTAGQVAESIVTDVITQLKDTAAQNIDKPLSQQITSFNLVMNESFKALASLRATKAILEKSGLPGGDVGSQMDRQTMAMSEQAAKISTTIVSTALSDLSADLDRVLVQPISIQATTVNSLFTDSMAALQALFLEWSRLNAEGIDSTGVQEQFSRLLGGVLESSMTVLRQAFTEGTFAEFLSVAASIPDALAAMNPELKALKELAAAFNQVVAPIAQAMQALEDSVHTLAERTTISSGRIENLRSAIIDAGDSAEQALPLYAQLAQEIITNANLQIEAIKEIQQAWEAAMDQVQSDIDELETTMGSLDDQITSAVGDMQQSAADFFAAAASGDLLKAIEAIHQYEQAVIALANLQIEQVEAQRQATIDAQQDVIDAIQSTIDAWNDAIAVIEAQISAWEDAIDAINDQISVYQDAIDAINDEISVHQDYIDALNDEISVYQDAIDAINKQISVYQDAIDAINDQKEAWQDAIDVVNDQIELWQDSIEAIQDQISAWEEYASVIQDQISAQEEVVSLLRDEVQAREDTVESLKNEIESLKQLQERVKGTTRSAVAPAQQVAAIQAEIEATQAHLDTVTGDEAIKDLEKLISLNEELLKVGEEYDQLVLIAEAIENLNALQEELNTRLAGKEGELSVAEQQLEVARLDLAASEAVLASLEAHLQATQDIVESLNDQIKVQQDIVDALNDQIEVYQDVIDGLDDQIKQYQDVIDLLNDQIQQYQDVIDLLNDQIKLQQDAIDLLNDQIEQYQDVIDLLNDQIALYQDVIDSLNDQIEVYQDIITAYEADMAIQQDILQAIQVSTIWDEQISQIQAAALAELYQIKSWLELAQGDVTWENQIIAIQLGAWTALENIHNALKALFAAQPSAQTVLGLSAQQVALMQYSASLQARQVQSLETIVGYNLKLPIPMTVSNFYDAPHQRGGLVGIPSGHYYAKGGTVHERQTKLMAHVTSTYDSLRVPHTRFARGGLINAMLEPGERVFAPPMNRAQQGALLAVNDAFPRFAIGGVMVPGSGSGDTVAARLALGSVVLNREASAALASVGMQGGGSIPPMSPPPRTFNFEPPPMRRMQEGGSVSGGSNGQPSSDKTEIHQHYYSFPNLTVRSQRDIDEIRKVFDEMERERLRRLRDGYRSDGR